MISPQTAAASITPRTIRMLLVGSSLGGLLVACGDSSAPDPQPYPVVWSWTNPTARTVSLRYLLPVSVPDCAADSVTVTGPGLSAALTLSCTAVRGAAFGADLDLSLAPPPLPLIYNFRATIDGQTTQQTAEVDCYQAPPSGIAPIPGATVASPVTLRWQLVPVTGIEYTVSAFLGGVTRFRDTVVDADSAKLTLPAGSYGWTVEAAPQGLHDGTSGRHCGSSWGNGSFTVP